MWIGSVSHDNKIRFWHAGYLFEEDDDDEDDEGDGETAGDGSAANAAGGGERTSKVFFKRTHLQVGRVAFSVA